MFPATVSYNSVCGYSGFREVTVTKTETETPFFNLCNTTSKFYSIIKDKQGGYSYKMGINCYTLDQDKGYILCIEMLNSDYQLWHKSVATIDKTTSQGVAIAGFTVQKFSHRYTNNSGSVECMYFIKITVNFQKTSSNLLYSLHLYVNISQVGSDPKYTANWTNNWMIAYGVFGKVSSIDPQKTYDCHTAFDIQPTQVVYNVPINMNRRKILNISVDRNVNNSVATLKMVKDLYPYTKHDMYRGIFPIFYDFSDASIYDLNTNVGGFTFTSLIPHSNVYHFPFTGLNPHFTFPMMTQANIVEGGLRLQNKTISFALNSGCNFTICVVMRIWLNKSFSIKTHVNSVSKVSPNLIYDKTNKTLKLQTFITTPTRANEMSITLPSNFNSKRVKLWLTKYGSQYGKPVG